MNEITTPFTSSTATRSDADLFRQETDYTPQILTRDMTLIRPRHAAAYERAETGIMSSAAHAEADVPGWASICMSLLGYYARNRPVPWTMEQFRAWAYLAGLPTPKEERCFGAITRKALKQGLIVKVGYAAAASSNNSPKATYRGVA